MNRQEAKQMIDGIMRDHQSWSEWLRYDDMQYAIELLERGSSKNKVEGHMQKWVQQERAEAAQASTQAWRNSR